MTHRLLFANLAVMIVATSGTVLAQHHHHHGRHATVHHHGSHYGHSNWAYVVPHSHHGHGAYYVANDAYYYTPTPVVRVIPSQTASIAPPVVQQPIQLQYGGFARCDDLAGRLERELNRLCLDLHYNYRQNQGFAHTYRDAYEVLQIAKRLHAKEHQGDREAISQTVARLDEQFHHVQQEITNWSRQPIRPIGTGDVLEKASATEALLHHLCFDVGVKPHEAEDEQAPPPTDDDQPAPSPGVLP